MISAKIVSGVPPPTLSSSSAPAGPPTPVPAKAMLGTLAPLEPPSSVIPTRAKADAAYDDMADDAGVWGDVGGSNERAAKALAAVDEGKLGLEKVRETKQ